VGVALDSAGYVYVSEFTGNRVQKFTSGGTYVAQFGSSGSGNGQFSVPWGLLINSLGYAYVVVPGQNRVEIFSPN
jgi:DNA-binding beta-propeller fold protein YncE